MGVAQSDGLVLFGASGDLAYKMIFPALAAMERRGRLNVPVIGVARTKWTLKQFRARVADSVREHGTPADRKALPALLRRMGYVAGEYHKRTTYAAIGRALGGAAAHDLLPGDPAQPVPGRRGWAGPLRLREERPSRRREAVRARPRVGAGAEPDRSHRVRRAVDLPHRSLPGQGVGAEPAGVPIRELVSRADLERALHRERSDHDGGDVRRRDARALLRGGGRDPRRRPEPPLAGGGGAGDGAAGPDLPRFGARREGEGVSRDPAAAAGRPRARSIRRLPAGEGRRARFDGGDVRGAAPAHRFVALGGRAVFHPRGQAPGDVMHRGAGDAQAAAAAARSRRRQLLSFSAEPGRHHRARRARQEAGRSDGVGADGAAPGASSGRERDASLRTAAGRGDGG